MRWFARLKTSSVPHTLWKRKGTGPYTFMNVPFKWEPVSASFITDELSTHAIGRLMDLPEIQMEVIQGIVPPQVIKTVDTPVEEKKVEPIQTEPTPKDSSDVQESKPRPSEPRKARPLSSK